VHTLTDCRLAPAAAPAAAFLMNSSTPVGPAIQTDSAVRGFSTTLANTADRRVVWVQIDTLVGPAIQADSAVRGSTTRPALAIIGLGRVDGGCSSGYTPVRARTYQAQLGAAEEMMILVTVVAFTFTAGHLDTNIIQTGGVRLTAFHVDVSIITGVAFATAHNVGGTSIMLTPKVLTAWGVPIAVLVLVTARVNDDCTDTLVGTASQTCIAAVSGKVAVLAFCCAACLFDTALGPANQIVAAVTGRVAGSAFRLARGDTLIIDTFHVVAAVTGVAA
jgi:hypothetical protein